MATIPTDRNPDSTLAFLRAGYRFIGQRCERYGTDIFQTRLLLEPTICVRGRAAAELFYDADRFVREGAMPARGKRTLTGRGGRGHPLRRTAAGPRGGPEPDAGAAGQRLRGHRRAARPLSLPAGPAPG
ncbi:hypothetical protein [Micromonospora sp. NPDC000442]|uniref:hypothetical protein n=1 Tax=Micromonospora sp. NPDC000442 TaxID=3364217 RepID=UPI0036C03DF0